MFSGKNKYLAILMWLLPLSFFTYQFILRLWPGLMAQQIMEQFAIDATAFGLMASVYYYGYAGMQIPIAILLDRYGARYIIFFSALVCGVGTFVFSHTDNWYLALLSRFLIGAGSAVGFLGTSKIISQWFRQEHYARMVGFSFTIGLMGAIYGGKPVSLLVQSMGWEKVVLVLSVVSLIIGFLTYLFLKPPKSAQSAEQEKFKATDFKQLLSSPFVWFLAVANLLMVGALEGFADVWGINYLMAAHNITKSQAAELTSFIFVGMLFGGPILALFSRKFGNYAVISACGFGMSAIFCHLLFSSGAFNWYALATTFFTIGMLCCYQVIVFAAGCDLVSAKLLGVTVAFLNCINMLGGSFFHSIIGSMMDKFWTGEIRGGIRHYTIDSYNQALLIIPACAFSGALIIVFLGLKKKNRK